MRIEVTTTSRVTPRRLSHAAIGEHCTAPDGGANEGLCRLSFGPAEEIEAYRHHSEENLAEHGKDKKGAHGLATRQL